MKYIAQIVVGEKDIKEILAKYFGVTVNDISLRSVSTQHDGYYVDCIVKRAIAHNDGKYDDVFVIRDGQKLRFDEVATFEPEEVEDD